MMNLLIYILLFIPSLIFKLILKVNKKEIWLISETNDRAEDNAYYLFKYIRENKPNELAYYVIDKKAKDYKKVDKYGNVINWGSLKHYLYYLVAKNISTEENNSPYKNLVKSNRIFLQRGITKDDIDDLHYDKTKFKLFVCGAKREYEYIKNNFNYPEKNIKFLGLPRFDEFNNIEVDNNKILIMPTCRNYIKNNFSDTEYYKKWNSLINNNELIEYIEKNNISIYFYLHHNMKKYIKEFNSKSKNIILVDDIDINELLKTSSLLITDYSSVYMDFAYMSKPVIYYQFDYKDYRASGYKEGYFKYNKDAFGKIIIDEEDLVKKIIAYDELDYKMEKVYSDRITNFFEIKDQNNCKRVYEAIKEI